jgi:hypothetical protein
LFDLVDIVITGTGDGFRIAFTAQKRCCGGISHYSPEITRGKLQGPQTAGRNLAFDQIQEA